MLCPFWKEKVAFLEEKFILKKNEEKYVFLVKKIDPREAKGPLKHFFFNFKHFYFVT